jgi:Bacteriophage minor capsid protein
VTLAEALAAYLQTQGQGTLGVDLFGGFLPDTTTGGGNARALLEYPGGGIVRVMGGIAWELATVQLLTRHRSLATAQAWARAAYLALEAMPAGTYSGIRISAVNAKQPPGYVGDDANGLPLVSVNFEVWRG